jgi:arylsulfatase A-like enzyme
MDALAASGTSFEQSYCAAPVCGPSRACIATGRLPHENGVLVNGMSIFPSMPTIGEIFGSAGYDTAWTGRWCVPDNGPDIRGFDCLHDTNQPLGQGMFSDSHVADCAIDYLGRDHEKPFLLGVSLCNPHDICYWVMQQSTPQGELDAHTVALKTVADSLPFDFPTEGEFPPLPDNFAIHLDEPEFITQCRKRPHYGQEMTFTWDWDEPVWRRYLHAYYRLTELVDIQVGRVMTALRESGLEEDTFVVLTSDHGEGMAGHKWVVKLGLYEEPMRVPLIFSHPGSIPASASNVNTLSSGIDILPTMCDYTSAPCPEVTGISLRPFINHAELQGRTCLVSEFHPDSSDLDLQGRMVRSQRHKYVAFSHGTNPEQLFDLESDPGEKINLALGADPLPVLDDHRSILAEWLAAHDDPFLPSQA